MDVRLARFALLRPLSFNWLEPSPGGIAHIMKKQNQDTARAHRAQCLGGANWLLATVAGNSITAAFRCWVVGGGRQDTVSHLIESYFRALKVVHSNASHEVCGPRKSRNRNKAGGGRPAAARCYGPEKIDRASDFPEAHRDVQRQRRPSTLPGSKKERASHPLVYGALDWLRNG